MSDDDHKHEWVRRQNVTSKGYILPPYGACACGAATATPPDTGKSGTQYTVIGFYDAADLQVTGVIEGHHPVVGGDGGEWQPWAAFVTADSPGAAELVAREEMAEANGWNVLDPD